MVKKKKKKKVMNENAWMVISRTLTLSVILVRLSQYTLPPQSSRQKRAGGKSQLQSKQSSNRPFQENFLTIGGSLHISHRGTKMVKERKRKKERKKMNNFYF